VRDGYEIVYVYDTQERILVSYPVGTSPADRLDATQRQLTRRLLDARVANDAPVGPAVDGHVASLNRWAEYLGVVLPTESEAALERACMLAAEAVGGQRDRADALAAMKTCLLSGCLGPASPPTAPESQQDEKRVAEEATEPL
jgi:hypothetical protein